MNGKRPGLLREIREKRQTIERKRDMSVHKTILLKIEIVSTGYHLTVGDWFVGSYKTVADLQERVRDLIARKTL